MSLVCLMAMVEALFPLALVLEVPYEPRCRRQQYRGCSAWPSAHVHWQSGIVEVRRLEKPVEHAGDLGGRIDGRDCP